LIHVRDRLHTFVVVVVTPLGYSAGFAEGIPIVIRKECSRNENVSESLILTTDPEGRS